MASMWALVVAVIYFGSFLAIGFIAKAVLAKLMEQTGADLSDVKRKRAQTAGSARYSCWEFGVTKNEREVRRCLARRTHRRSPQTNSMTRREIRW